MEDLEGVKFLDNMEIVVGVVDFRILFFYLERLLSICVQDWEDEVEEEESSDDDCNYKY